MKLKDLLESTPAAPSQDQPDLRGKATDDIDYAIATLADIGRRVKTLPGADALDKAVRQLMGAYRRESQSRQRAPQPGD